MRTILMLAAISPLVAHNDFRWAGDIGPGKTVEIRGVNGNIVAERAPGGVLDVTTIKTGSTDPESVRIDYVEHSGGVTIRAVYTQNNDVKVHFTVRVPDGVNFIGNTVNGRVEANNLDGEVIANTVNGDVRIGASGPVQGKTVNGTIHASIGKPGWDKAMQFSTVNGGITIELPAGSRAEVEASTVNGSISTDFPMTVHSRAGDRKINGAIGGGGGPKLGISTVNGSIRLKAR